MKITTKKDILIVQLEGVERVWAFNTGFNIKRADISKISWSADKPHWRNMMAVRAPGTGVPKIFYAGTFVSRRGAEFWYLKMQEPGYLVITTNDGRYRNVRLTVSQAVGIQLKKWFEEAQKVSTSKKTTKKPVKKARK